MVWLKIICKIHSFALKTDTISLDFILCTNIKCSKFMISFPWATTHFGSKMSPCIYHNEGKERIPSCLMQHFHNQEIVTIIF